MKPRDASEPGGSHGSGDGFGELGKTYRGETDQRTVTRDQIDHRPENRNQRPDRPETSTRLPQPCATHKVGGGGGLAINSGLILSCVISG